MRRSRLHGGALWRFRPAQAALRAGDSCCSGLRLSRSCSSASFSSRAGRRGTPASDAEAPLTQEEAGKRREQGRIAKKKEAEGVTARGPTSITRLAYFASNPFHYQHFIQPKDRGKPVAPIFAHVRSTPAGNARMSKPFPPRAVGPFPLWPLPGSSAQRRWPPSPPSTIRRQPSPRPPSRGRQRKGSATWSRR